MGADLGLGAGTASGPVPLQAACEDGDLFTAAINDDIVPISVSHNESIGGDGKDIYAGMQTLSIKKDQEEPEFMRRWKEEQQERLGKKAEEETAAMKELKQKAQQELAEWYKRLETQLEKTKSINREEEAKYRIDEVNHIEPGSEWERVAKHCDFSTKAPGHTKDVSRMRSIMLQLKQSQTVKA